MYLIEYFIYLVYLPEISLHVKYLGAITLQIRQDKLLHTIISIIISTIIKTTEYILLLLHINTVQ